MLEELSHPSPIPRPQGLPFFLEPHLGNQLPLLVHADVEARLSSSDSNPAPKGICLHNELCCWGWRGKVIGRSLTPTVQVFTPTDPTDLSHPSSNFSKGQVPKTWALAPAQLQVCCETLVKSPFWASGLSTGFTEAGGCGHGVPTGAIKLKIPSFKTRQ